MQENNITPTDIKVNSQTKNITISFSNNETYMYPAEYLRVYSPSAEVRGHGEAPPKLVHGRFYVGIMDVNLVGNYAMRISFDDMHDSGIFTWNYLYELGKEYEAYWDMYLKRLEKEKKKRTP